MKSSRSKRLFQPGCVVVRVNGSNAKEEAEDPNDGGWDEHSCVVHKLYIIIY